jgi:hypothetical protein
MTIRARSRVAPRCLAGAPGRARTRFLGAGRLKTVRSELAEVNARMLQALDVLGVLEVAGSIPGVSALQVAAILAQTGDPSRFATAALIRQIHAIITRRIPWDADIAAGQRRPGQEVNAAA